jgi:hypothetical protein
MVLGEPNINFVDENEMRFTIIGIIFWFQMHGQTLGSCLKWGSDKTFYDSNFVF